MELADSEARGQEQRRSDEAIATERVVATRTKAKLGYWTVAIRQGRCM